MSFLRGHIRNLRHSSILNRSLSTICVPSFHKYQNNQQFKNDSYYFKYGNYILLSALGISLSLGINQFNSKSNNVSACGIVGMVGNEDCIDFLLEGLSILQNRGYDSAGIATISHDTNNDSPKSSDKDSNNLDTKATNSFFEHLIKVTKYASVGSTSDSLELVQRDAPMKHLKDITGIAHTRWATHGAKTDENAHPHVDYKNRIALVHNGTIENSEDIKQELKKFGIPFRSQTDTEVMANLVSYYLDQIDSKTNETYSIEDALALALSQLDGSWGIAMIAKDRPNEIFAARNGSPLMIGLDPTQNRNFIASEHTAFQRYTNDFIPLEEGEIAVISANSVNLDHSRIQRANEFANNNNLDDLMLLGGSHPGSHVPISPAPYDHWTLKEMMEQPAAVSRALAYGSRLAFDDVVKLGGLDKNKELLMSIKHLVMTGCGTSYHAALYAQRLMQFLNSFDTVGVVDSAEVTTDTFPSQNAGLLAISQSGETKDVVNAINTAEMLSIPRFSVVNAVGSMIARKTDLGVYAYAGREHAVASTKAFVSQTTVLALIAAWFSQNRIDEMQSEVNDNLNDISNKSSFLLNKPKQHHMHHQHTTMDIVDQQRRNQLVSALHRLPTYCGVTLNHTKDICEEIAQDLYDSGIDHMFILGKGFGEPIAYEGALKVKELSYVHCEGYSGGALKHGPFALIEDGTPVVMIILDDQHSKTMITNAHEIESRGGKVIIITDNINIIARSGLHTRNIVKIPTNGCLTALLAVIPLQYIAYGLAVRKGHNPDKPKNLAKAVTVD